MVSNAGPVDKPKNARKRPLWVIVLCGILMIFLIGVLTFLGLVFHEFWKAIPPPRNPDSTAQLLVLNEPPAIHQGRGEKSSVSQAQT